MNTSNDNNPNPAPGSWWAEGEPAIGLPTTRADALLPADLLQGGETIILLLKPSLLYNLLAALEVVGGLVGLSVILLIIEPWLNAQMTLPIPPRQLAVILLTVAVLRVFWQFLQWISEIYVLTDQRVIRVRNFFRPEVFQTPLIRLQHTELIFSIRERLFGLGSIAFSTAGTGLAEAYWLMIRRPMAVHRKIVQAISRAQGNSGA